jgi:uncharacterized protein YjbI with pentapeptide repeats
VPLYILEQAADKADLEVQQALERANLARVRLRKVHLQQASLRHAYLQELSPDKTTIKT